ncbi:MAG: hypothetical protein HRJ53_03005 [Acidobacteria bacterium Pan2503]|uniref:Uncharacterized protein n=1 Tax=Candidatus Acidiferrum panamense TaxID=2741543 RepID=A0A7V8SVT1_9BACT|nr:hypothetical protein [Candidatus Acidoferrum panamensis]
MNPEKLPRLFRSVEGYFVHCDHCQGLKYIGGMKCAKCEGEGWLFVVEKFNREVGRRVLAILIVIILCVLLLFIFK